MDPRTPTALRSVSPGRGTGAPGLSSSWQSCPPASLRPRTCPHQSPSYPPPLPFHLPPASPAIRCLAPARLRTLPLPLLPLQPLPSCPTLLPSFPPLIHPCILHSDHQPHPLPSTDPSSSCYPFFHLSIHPPAIPPEFPKHHLCVWPCAGCWGHSDGSDPGSHGAPGVLGQRRSSRP